MKKVKRFLLILSVLLLVAVGLGLWWTDQALKTPWDSGQSWPVVFEIEPGMGAGAICQKAADMGLVRHPALLKVAFTWKGDPRAIPAGEYQIPEKQSPLSLMKLLMDGRVMLYQVTFPEGLRRDQMVELMVEKGFGEADVLEALTGDPSPIADLDPHARDLEGYLFPETYSLPKNADRNDLIEAMNRQFRRSLPEDWNQRLKDLGLTHRQGVTLASIIEKETALEEERTHISGVFHNRLRRKMLLQTDPTIIYSLVQLNQYDGNITRENKLVDHPYNTYVYPGLPPGPICSPGKASLHAAVNPLDTEDLYFVSRNDGSHVFAPTYREHLRNVRKWQQEYWRKKWAEEKKQAGK